MLVEFLVIDVVLDPVVESTAKVDDVLVVDNIVDPIVLLLDNDDDDVSVGAVKVV